MMKGMAIKKPSVKPPTIPATFPPLTETMPSPTPKPSAMPVAPSRKPISPVTALTPTVLMPTSSRLFLMICVARFSPSFRLISSMTMAGSTR